MHTIEHPIFDLEPDHDKVLWPEDRQDDFTRSFKSEGSLRGVKRLDDGNYAGVLRLAFTVAIVHGLTRGGMYTTRYCFSSLQDCLAAYEGLTSLAQEPEGWIAARPQDKQDRKNSLKAEAERVISLRARGIDPCSF